MIKSLIGGFAQIAAKPQVLIAGIIATIVQFAIAYLTIEPLVNLVEKAFILQELPNVGLIELPLQFYRMYFAEVNVLILALLASMIVQLWLGVTIARFANNLRDGKKGISEALGFGIKHLGKIIAAIVFLVFVAALFFAAFQAIVWLSDYTIELSIALTALLALFTAYVYVKLVFFIPIMGCRQANVHDALAEAWNFSVKKFWKIVLLLILIAVVAGIIELVGSAIAEIPGNETAFIVILAVFSIIASTYSALVLANYYLNHEGEHPKMFYEARQRRKSRK